MTMSPTQAGLITRIRGAEPISRIARWQNWLSPLPSGCVIRQVKAGAAVGTKRGVARCNRQIDPGMLVPQLRIRCGAVQRQAISADLARLLRLCGSGLGLIGVAHYWLIRQK